MSKVGFVYICWLTVLWLFSCAQKPAVESIIDKMVAAQGGAAALQAINDQVSVWDSKSVVPAGDSMMTVASEMVITFKRPNKIKFESKMPDGRIMYASVFDGTNGWVSIAGQVREMVETELQENEILALTWIDGWLDFANRGFEVELLADSTIDGKTYHVLQTTDKYGVTTIAFINPATYFIERTVSEGTNAQTLEREPYSMTFDEYEKFDNFMMSKKVASYGPTGELIFEVTLKEVRNNTGVPDEAFARPAGNVAALQ